MRPIKFRGKRVDNGEWVEGDLLKDGLSTFIFPTSAGWFEFVNKTVNVIPETIGQFTGLRDKNGKEIYEGDVLKEATPRSHMFKVWNEQGGFVMNQFQDDFKATVEKISFWQPMHDMQNISYINTSLEIIGNIHDNHELLTNG
jgi:uncharacterized phage protein (TIGR01671 family)